MKKLKILFLTIASVSIVLLTGCQNAAGGNTDPVIDPVNYTVVFNSNGGSPVASISVTEGTSVSKPADPTNVPHNFLGWFNGSSIYDFNSEVNSDLLLTAKWTETVTTKVRYISHNTVAGAYWTGTMTLDLVAGTFSVSSDNTSTDATVTYSGTFKDNGASIEFLITDCSQTAKIGKSTTYNVNGKEWTWTGDPAFYGFGYRVTDTTQVDYEVLETVEQ